MKKLIMCDFGEYHSALSRLANYHYCTCFVKDGYEALWMSNPFNQMIYFKDKSDYYFKKSITGTKRHKLDDNIFGFAPYSFWLYGNYPGFRNASLALKQGKFIYPNIKKTLAKLNFLEAEILWISNPKSGYLAHVVQYRTLVYRIADDYRQFPHYPNVQTIDDFLIDKADIIVLSSSTLANRVRERGKEPLILSNGVESDHFSRPAGQPQEYKGNYRKKIVYVGAITFWFDIGLIRNIAEHIEADIFLIGKPQADVSSLTKYSNIHILGPRKYETLPGYLQHADVALIPFIKNDLTDSVSPIKLYEYCSAGVAVVSTNLEEISRIGAPIRIGADHNSFINGIRHYLDCGYDREILKEYGCRNSWSHRYSEVRKVIAKQ
ncbi:MAG: glycosyltransferase [Syntrophales bacterium]|nr:glycosyltransferase [Syntrophales bacterium]MDY0044462.1 glycosyltransferase [Syntrophales bacterium]